MPAEIQGPHAGRVDGEVWTDAESADAPAWVGDESAASPVDGAPIVLVAASGQAWVWRGGAGPEGEG